MTAPETRPLSPRRLYGDWASPLADKAREVIKWYQPEAQAAVGPIADVLCGLTERLTHERRVIGN
jgi:hypothetical protein